MRRRMMAILSRLVGRESRPRFSRVAPWLIVGPALSPVEFEALKAEGVTHVIDLRAEAADDPRQMRSLELELMSAPVADRRAPSSEQVLEIVQWLDTGSAGQPVVYVHCQGGLGRAPIVAAAILMLRGWTRVEAYRLVTVAHQSSAPTPDQHEWLEQLEQDLASGRLKPEARDPL